MTYPLVQIVATPDPDADVLFDFNTAGDWADDETWPEHDGFTLGAPSLEGDPGAFGAEEGIRTIACNLIVKATAADAAAQMSTLARAVRKRRGWLRFQATEFSSPLWFRTYRTAQGAIDFELVRNTGDVKAQFWGLGITLNADPYAQGERVTLGPFTINNDVAAGTNPCSVVLPEIVGDAPAPVRLDMTGTYQQIPSPTVGVTPVPDDYAPVTVQFGVGDTVLAGVDMGAAASAGGYSGGSYRPVTFATTEGMANRCTVPLPDVRPGRYAVWVRAARPFAALHTFNLQAVMNSRTVGDIVPFDRPAFTSGAYRQWVDLGTFSIPAGLSDYDTTGLISTSVDIWASRTSGSADLWLDVLTLVPVELFEDEPGLRMTVLPDMVSSSPEVFRIDGDDGYFQHYSADPAMGGVLVPTNPTELYRGKWPVVTPGRKNLLWLFRQTSGAAREDGQFGDLRATVSNTDLTTMTTAVTVSYAPRWLWLAAQ